MVINFAPSQLTYKVKTSPINFRLSPFKLLWSDLRLIPHVLLTALNFLLPLATNNRRGELNFRERGNIISILLQVYIAVISGVGLLGICVVIFFPISVLGFGLYCVVIAALCAPAIIYLNRGDPVVGSNPGLAAADADIKYQHEKWFFINGIIVGDHWLQTAIDELSMLFGRRVWGIRNTTFGFFFDVIECLIQRDFGYNTKDIRVAYTNIKQALLDPSITKVVVIAHSQGGIVLSNALDNLLADLPREYFKNFEVYTFASAANHFNNPRMSTAITSLAAVSAVEHYANAKDPVSLIGVLKFLPLVVEDPLNVYAGRLFERPDQSGHMFVQHYLDTMFGSHQDFLDLSMTTQTLRPTTTTETPQETRAATQTVGEVSRLAKYLNGESPPDSPTSSPNPS